MAHTRDNRFTQRLEQVIAELVTQEDSSWLVDSRRWLEELAANPDSDAQRAAFMWKAGLGAYIKMRTVQGDAAEHAARQMVELVAVGLDAFMAFLEEQAIVTAGDIEPGSDSAEAEVELAESLVALAAVTRAVVAGDPDALDDIEACAAKTRKAVGYLGALQS